MNVSHIENAGQVPIKELIEKYGSSPMFKQNWTDKDWNLERTLARVHSDLGIGVFIQMDVSTSLFNTSHRSLGVSLLWFYSLYYKLFKYLVKQVQHEKTKGKINHFIMGAPWYQRRSKL